MSIEGTRAKTTNAAHLAVVRSTYSSSSWEEMAGVTGLEPATSGVTGQHSNRLNYHSAENENCNGHLRCLQYFFVVGAEGIEPPTRSL